MITALLLALALPTDAAPCRKTAPQAVANTQVYMASLGDLCFVSVSARDSYQTLVYRSYALFDDGLIMVFNSYGAGDDVSRLTSAREFYVFPRSGRLSFQADDQAGTLTVTLVNGYRLSFDTATGQLSGSDRGSVTVAPRVEPGNRGGVEIADYRGLLLDAGFAMGRSPASRRASQSTFRDADGRSCVVRNDEIFEYTPDGEHALKHDDVRLIAFLKTRCPGLEPGYQPIGVGLGAPSVSRGYGELTALRRRAAMRRFGERLETALGQGALLTR